MTTASRTHAVVLTEMGCGRGGGVPVGRRCRRVPWTGALPRGAPARVAGPVAAGVPSALSLMAHAAFQATPQSAAAICSNRVPLLRRLVLIMHRRGLSGHAALWLTSSDDRIHSWETSANSLGLRLAADMRVQAEVRLPDLTAVPDAIGRHALKIVQEALTNADRSLPADGKPRTRFPASRSRAGRPNRVFPRTFRNSAQLTQNSLPGRGSAGSRACPAQSAAPAGSPAPAPRTAPAGPGRSRR